MVRCWTSCTRSPFRRSSSGIQPDPTPVGGRLVPVSPPPRLGPCPAPPAPETVGTRSPTRGRAPCRGGTGQPAPSAPRHRADGRGDALVPRPQRGGPVVGLPDRAGRHQELRRLVRRRGAPPRPRRL